MIKKPTVFVLGAGASQPYGYPSGKELVDEIIEELLNRRSMFRFCSALEFNKNEIITFAEALNLSGDYSIDEFLGRNPDFEKLGKAAITLALIKRENGKTLFSGGEDKWYGDLINELKTPSLDKFNNKVSFLTFNYDRSFDEYLFHAIKYSYGITDEECSKKIRKIPIIHLHGQIGKLPWQDEDGSGRPYDRNVQALNTINHYLNARPKPSSAVGLSSVIHYIRRLSGQIRIIHDKDLDKDIGFKKARKLLMEAERIYFLGFGYSNENLRRLRISELTSSIQKKTKNGISQTRRLINGTSYGIGEVKRIQILSFTNGKIQLSGDKFKILEFIKEQIAFE